MKDRRSMLKVKVKSLAEEARIIRLEEIRTKDAQLKAELAGHRRQVVRYHARTTHMAYGMIRGRDPARVEKPTKPRDEIFWKAVMKMVQQYGPVDQDQRIAMLERCVG